MGRWEDTAGRLVAQAEALAENGEPLEAAAVLNQVGLAALEGGLLPRSRGLFEQVAATYVAEGHSFHAAAAQANLALVCMRAGELEAAAHHFERALALLDESRAAIRAAAEDLDLREADIRVNLGVLYRRLSALDAAAEEYRQAQELYRRHGPLADVLDVEGDLAVLDERAGRFAEARRRLIRVREQIPAGTEDRARARAATTLATVAGQEGRFDEAGRLLDEARTTYTVLGLPRELAEVITNRGYVHLHTGDLAAARRHLDQAEVMFERMGMQLDRARVLGGLGSLELRLGNVVDAVERYTVAMEVYDALGLHRELAGTLVNLGVAHAQVEGWDSAAELQRAALEIYADLGQLRDGAAQAEHNLGFALAGQGEYRQAIQHYGRARSVYRQLGRHREAAEITVSLAIAVAATGDEEGARRRYRRAPRELRTLGLWPQLARCVHNLGLTWPSGSHERRQRVLPAWLALDSRRFALPSAVERSGWRGVIGSPSAAALDTARHDPLLLAEVIEHARAVGAPHDPGAPAPVVGLVDTPAARRPEAQELPARPPVRVDCGWPATLTPYVNRARALSGPDVQATTDAGGDRQADLVRLLLAGAPPTEAP